MKNKGFTLVELLAVILVMVIIATLVVTSAFSIVNNSKKEQYDVLVSEIEQAVKLYLNDNYENYVVGRDYKYLSVRFLDDKGSAKLYVKLGDLADAGLIKPSEKDDKSYLVDPRNNNEISLEYYVVAIYENSDLVIEKEFVTETSYSDTDEVIYNKDTGTYSINTSNNYVSLNNQIWRIIKVNKDGSIRLLLDDESMGKSVFGVDGSYDSSYVLTNMQYWLIYDVYSGTKDLIRETSLSLITDTEYTNLKEGVVNPDYLFWMISSNGNVVLSDNSNADYNTSEAMIRPVIELKPNAIYVSGDGSSDKPYTVR